MSSILLDIGYISYSEVFSAAYLLFVVPSLFWLANLFVCIQTKRGKRIPSWLFWLVNIITILISFVMCYPVFTDISEMGIDRFDIYGLTLVLLVIAPLVVSYFAIAMRIRK
ncbi:MAG: hypothetical protein AAF193_03775 [Bacteroidota bacterium]